MSYMKRVICFLFLIYNINGISQGLTWTEPIRVGRECKSISKDSKNNLYFAGVIHNDLTNPIYFNKESLPIFSEYYSYGLLIKTDKDYKTEWTKIMKSSGVSIYKMQVDREDNIIIVGSFMRSIIIDSLELNFPNDERRILITKFNSSGKLIWYNLIRYSSWDFGISDFKIGNDGSIYLTGNGIGPATFYNDNVEVTTINHPNHIAFFGKYSSSGNFEWVKALMPNYQMEFNAIEVDQNENIYLTGWWFGDGTFETIPKVSFSSDIIIAKFNPNRELIWLKQIGSPSNDILESGKDIVLDENLNSLYVTGGFLGTANFGGKILQANDENIFLARYSLDGDLILAKKMGSWSGAASYIEEGTHLMIDQVGFIYLAGTIGRNGNFDGTQVSAYEVPGISNLYTDSFMAKYTATGKLLWVNHAGNPGTDDVFSDYLKDNDNNLFFVGKTKGGAIFGNYELSSDDNYDVGYACKIKDPIENILELSNYSLTFGADTNLIKSFDVISNLGWSLSTVASWISINSMSAIGNSIVTLVAQTNATSEQRNAIVNIISAGGIEKQISISQEKAKMIEVVTAVEPPSDNNEIKIYPNPVNNTIQFSAKNNNLSKATLIIIDIAGRELISMPNLEDMIYVNTLNPGMYFLKIKTHEFQVIKRFVKL